MPQELAALVQAAYQQTREQGLSEHRDQLAALVQEAIDGDTAVAEAAELWGALQELWFIPDWGGPSSSSWLFWKFANGNVVRDYKLAHRRVTPHAPAWNEIERLVGQLREQLPREERLRWPLVALFSEQEVTPAVHWRESRDAPEDTPYLEFHGSGTLAEDLAALGTVLANTGHTYPSAAGEFDGLQHELQAVVRDGEPRRAFPATGATTVWDLLRKLAELGLGFDAELHGLGEDAYLVDNRGGADGEPVRLNLS